MNNQMNSQNNVCYICKNANGGINSSSVIKFDCCHRNYQIHSTCLKKKFIFTCPICNRNTTISESSKLSIDKSICFEKIKICAPITYIIVTFALYIISVVFSAVKYKQIYFDLKNKKIEEHGEEYTSKDFQNDYPKANTFIAIVIANILFFFVIIVFILAKFDRGCICYRYTINKISRIVGTCMFIQSLMGFSYLIILHYNDDMKSENKMLLYLVQCSLLIVFYTISIVYFIFIALNVIKPIVERCCIDSFACCKVKTKIEIKKNNKNNNIIPQPFISSSIGDAKYSPSQCFY